MTGARGGDLAWDDVPEREQQVAALIADGLTDKAIGRALGVSVWTVRTYVARLVERIGVDPDRSSRSIITRWHRAHAVPSEQRAA